MANQFIIQGRIVFGHPGKPREKKDVRTRQPIIKDGQKIQQYVFGVAIDKPTFGAQVWPMLYNESKIAFPNGIPSNFSYKFKDGDTNDSKGQPYGKREGYAGHCVLTISTEGFAPQIYKHENGAYRQLAPEEIKCGDFVAVNLTIKYNGAVSPNTPGLYINPNGIILIGYGQEIASAGQDPDEMFAGFQGKQFAGMTAQPTMAAAPLPAGMAPAGHQPPAGYAPQPQPGYAPAPAALPAPAHDFVQNVVQPQPGYVTAPTSPGYGQAPAGYTPQPVQQPVYAPAGPQTGYAQPAGQPTYPAQPGYPAGTVPGR